MTQSFTVTCTGKKEITRDVFELRFTKPDDFEFDPGQFVLIDVPLASNPDDIQTRAYSIASTPDEDELLLCIRKRPDGRMGQWLNKGLEEGTEVRIQGPLGNFRFDCENNKDCLFVATGVGMAPFRSQISSALKSGNKQKMDLVVGMYSEKDIFWSDEFSALAAQYPNFSFNITLSDPSPEWNGEKGWVQEIITKISDYKERSFYICGNPSMTKNMKQLCLEDWNIPKEDVHVEGYI